MVPYFICFIISITSAVISEYFYERNNRFIYIAGGSISILTMSIFAGIRDLNIGTDLGVYGLNTFNSATQYSTLSGYLSSSTINIYHIETGYAVLNYIISRFTHNANVFLFVLALIMYTLTYFSLIQFRKYSPVATSLFVYLMLFYGNSFSLLRQSFACTMVFLGIALFINQHRIKGLLFLILAPFFHSTGIIGILILIVWIWLIKIKENKIRKLTTFFILVFIVITAFSNQIINFLLNHNLINNVYSAYMDGTLSNVNSTEGTSIYNFYRLIFIFLFYLIWTKVKKNDILLFLFSMVVFDFLFLFIKGSAGQTIGRLGLYFSWFITVGYFSPVKQLEDKRIRILLQYLLFVLLIIIFIHITQKSAIGLGSGSQYYPYRSEILHIGE